MHGLGVLKPEFDYSLLVHKIPEFDRSDFKKLEHILKVSLPYV